MRQDQLGSSLANPKLQTGTSLLLCPRTKTIYKNSQLSNVGNPSLKAFKSTRILGRTKQSQAIQKKSQDLCIIIQKLDTCTPTPSLSTPIRTQMIQNQKSFDGARNTQRLEAPQPAPNPHPRIPAGLGFRGYYRLLHNFLVWGLGLRVCNTNAYSLACSADPTSKS